MNINAWRRFALCFLSLSLPSLFLSVSYFPIGWTPRDLVPNLPPFYVAHGTSLKEQSSLFSDWLVSGDRQPIPVLRYYSAKVEKDKRRRAASKEAEENKGKCLPGCVGGEEELKGVCTAARQPHVSANKIVSKLSIKHAQIIY